MPVGRGFRRFPPIPVSSRQVVNEISEFLRGTNVQQYGSSSSAAAVAVASERPVRKKVTKDERRALLESFVNKYRAMNSGKYPTAKTAQKEVGGCYYRLKRILQELEYNSKVASVDKELVKENKPSTAGEDVMNSDTTIKQLSEIEEVSSSQITMDPQLYEDAQQESISNLDTSDSNTQFELKEWLRTSTISEEIRKDDSHNVATETHDIAGEHLEVLHLHHQKPKQDLKKETQPEDKFEDVPKPKTEQHEQSMIENNRRDSSESLKDDELVLTEKPSIWQNLKSLANGFINIWKKPQ